ncbi:uncharacterized protein LOC111593260 isoform X2 [Drosophila hydei]|uniref:Uncharacterized protein LOC111593260 isoform X2 n=1 Tax=Drosophila hydei TaxID=7224 RepID=A0A6J1L9I0_DROHY|nr:uncharacterized protein LOC111593260 isoform X2 [Drosophila hydei]
MIPIHFVFDIIVTLLECHEIENWHAVKVVAKFGNKQIPITSSRINVSELKTGFGTDMIIGPTRLRKSLEDFGLTMTVSYKNKVIGSCKMILPQQTIDLIGIGMRDIVYSDTCRFGKAGEDVGKLGVLFRLIIKCEELENLVESPCVRNVDTLINEQDIMFVMSDVHRCPSFCEPCHDAFTDDDEADRKLRLDLQRYRSSVGKSQRATDIPTHNVFGELKRV